MTAVKASPRDIFELFQGFCRVGRGSSQTREEIRDSDTVARRWVSTSPATGGSTLKRSIVAGAPSYSKLRRNEGHSDPSALLQRLGIASMMATPFYHCGGDDALKDFDYCDPEIFSDVGESTADQLAASTERISLKLPSLNKF